MKDILEEGMERARKELPLINWVIDTWHDENEEDMYPPDDLKFILAELVAETKRTSRKQAILDERKRIVKHFRSRAGYYSHTDLEVADEIESLAGEVE